MSCCYDNPNQRKQFLLQEGPNVYEKNQIKRWKNQILFCLVVFLLGFFVVYIPLTIGCAKVDNESWKLYKYESRCWSEGFGDYANEGLLAGLIMGFGFSGAITVLVVWCRSTIPINLDESSSSTSTSSNNEPENASHQTKEKEFAHVSTSDNNTSSTAVTDYSSIV